jgi:hypothetical protein
MGRVTFSAVRRDVDEYIRNEWQRETDSAIEVRGSGKIFRPA